MSMKDFAHGYVHSTRNNEKIQQHKEQQENPTAQGTTGKSHSTRSNDKIPLHKEQQEDPTAQGTMKKSHKQSPGYRHRHLGQLMGCPGLEGTPGSSPWEGL